MLAALVGGDQEILDVGVDDADLGFLPLRIQVGDQLERDAHEEREELLEYFAGHRVAANPAFLLCLHDPLLGLTSPHFHFGDAFTADFRAGRIASGPDREACKPLLAARVGEG